MTIDYDELCVRLERSGETFGLLTMQATSTTGRLMARLPNRLKALFSAEHGFFGSVPPGERAASAWHPFWNRPIHSLYGDHRKPTPEMLEGIDRMVIDLCDIGVRCYTYLATLKNTLEACAENGIAVTVLDRPVPLGGIVDGPMRRPDFASFVAPIDVPLCHGMTPGECAMWITRSEGLNLHLDVVKVRTWCHLDRAPWPNFIPPSPAIRSWDSAIMYPLTLFTEAYPSVDCDRAGALAFRVIGAPWMSQKALYDELTKDLKGCGVEMRPYRYVPVDGKYKGMALDGILFSVGNNRAFYPVTAGLLVLAALMRRYEDKLAIDGRDDWFDKLCGSTAPREALKTGHLGGLFQDWLTGQDRYLSTKVNLYK